KLGLMYDKGLGLTQDYRKAFNWYGKSAKNGFGLAQYKIGQMYIAGNGVKQNFIKAFAWLKTAISQGVNDNDNILANIASELTPEQLAEANSLTRQYLEKYTVRH
ncbi:MAG: tetratricopeptide repeat protein, partial [Gammaproteobacteria bacterium]